MSSILRRRGPVKVRQPERGWLAAVLCCLLCGCGPAGEERPDLHPATGSVLINGQPAEGALLVFHPVDVERFDDRGTRPTATVAADGSFSLTTYQEGDGAPAGDYRVAILWFDDPDSSSPWDKLGSRFADPQTSEILVTVEPGRDRLDPIRVDGAEVLSRRPEANTRDFDQVD